MLKRIILPMLGLALALPAQARDEAKKAQKDANKSLIEHHQKMADVHERAADCLEKKSEAECRRELLKDCPMDKEHCSMVFDHGRMGKSKSMRDAPRDEGTIDPSMPDSGTRERGY